MRRKKGSTIITRTDARGRIKTIDVHGPAADALFRALMKEEKMGQAPEKDFEKYANTSNPPKADATAPENPTAPAGSAKDEPTEELKIETNPETGKQIITDADGKIVGEQG